LRRHFRAIRDGLVPRRSKTAGRGLALDGPGRGAISGHGFNLFKPLRCHFRAARSPSARNRVAQAAFSVGEAAAYLSSGPKGGRSAAEPPGVLKESQARLKEFQARLKHFQAQAEGNPNYSEGN